MANPNPKGPPQSTCTDGEPHDAHVWLREDQPRWCPGVKER